MAKKYTLEFLSEMFAKHAIETEKFNKGCLKSFIEKNPGKKIPKYFKDDLSLPLAIKTIVDELIALKEDG